MINLKPDERLSHIKDIEKSGGAKAIIEYFINELSSNVKFKHFDDKCYWIEVREVLKSQIING